MDNTTEKNQQIIDAWNELKTLVDAVELDINKCAAGNAAAGGRTRKGLRLLKTKAALLVKQTLEFEKTNKASAKKDTSEEPTPAS